MEQIGQDWIPEVLCGPPAQRDAGWGFGEMGEGIGWRQIYEPKVLGLGDWLGESVGGELLAGVLAGTVAGVAKCREKRRCSEGP